MQPAFDREYQQHAGSEGTVSAGVQALHVRRSRYIGLATTHLQRGLMAAVMNLIRAGARLGGKPPARSRQSAFAKLMTIAVRA